MARISQRCTVPEMAVQRALRAAGCRYRLNARVLPGSPDIVLPAKRRVIFVHGCFWHQHPGCSHPPGSNRAYWIPKLLENRRRDSRAARRLRRAGWRVSVIWECETRRPQALARRIRLILGR